MAVREKQKALFLLALITAAVFLLGGGLENGAFQPGLPFPAGDAGLETQAAVQVGTTPAGVPAGTVFQAVAGLLFVLVLLSLVIILIKGLARRYVLYAGGGLAVLVLLMLLVPAIRPGPPTTGGGLDLYTPVPETEIATAPIGDPPRAMNGLVTGGLALLGLVLAGWVLTRSARKPEADAVRREAENAVRAIRSGQDLGNAIVRCYIQMSRALLEEGGIDRDEAMTAREFEVYLKARGVPREPVHELTRLFERVRYGHGHPLTGQDEQVAIESLTAIIRYCRETKASPVA